jgi:hypothetical protein
VIPVEVTQAPWHYTTCLDLIDHWQTGLVGAGAVIAAVVTIGVTLWIDRRQAKRELETLRKALAVELRLHIRRAFGAYDGLLGLGSMPDGPITAWKVKSKSQMAAPIIYPANAGKIGLLGAEAMDVVIVYDLLEIARDRAALLTNYRTPDDITPALVVGTAQAFLAACSYARGVLPKLRTGDPSHDDKDEELTQQISAALASRRA